ncbi:MAG TPA: enoyl-CoA hydratase-related protein [Ferruginibacter sp.]|jgi:enoyl-CoA hydratase|nr:enoyl-CoA hydratase/isomerase family protein [Bacteroidota bacterium]MCC6693935.1 enoyl-CoA hydratase/isomerase family protein [Chitinophagaceae bacterium]HMT95349.1 enoyl-CoA hydratase-related protein [Ferruginibacter sp.]MBS1925601.1 enoyl-CoA hydratase/isomerase family protein [Bacteroidota bacterium]HMU24590.1 enoyl-CoA hydratase-related protein [Ferruginibacter sp.]
MTFDTLLFAIENNTAIITINRPDKLNALNKNVFDDLDKAVDAVNENPEIHSALITGAGSKAFVAGADITEFGSLSIVEARQLSERGQQVFFKIENSPKPFVAAVNGFALGGGCELAMSCHFRLCSDNAKFGQPEVNLGLIPGYGGTQRLTQLIGKGKSMELQMTAQMIDAQEALRLGLVNYVTPSDDLLTRTKEILAVINSKAPLAVAKIIECINHAVTNNNYSGFEKEVEAFGFTFGTEDMLEGTQAFLEKRKASFKGK